MSSHKFVRHWWFVLSCKDHEITNKFLNFNMWAFPSPSFMNREAIWPTAYRNSVMDVHVVWTEARVVPLCPDWHIYILWGNNLLDVIEVVNTRVEFSSHALLSSATKSLELGAQADTDLLTCLLQRQRPGWSADGGRVHVQPRRVHSSHVDPSTERELCLPHTRLSDVLPFLHAQVSRALSIVLSPYRQCL